MADCMAFPATFEEFAEQYKIVDSEEIYTNGTELIPIFRVEQWLRHQEKKQIPVEPNGEYCPCCKRHLRKPKVSIGYTGKVKNRNGDAYCPSCGQSIEWGDTE